MELGKMGTWNYAPASINLTPAGGAPRRSDTVIWFTSNYYSARQLLEGKYETKFDVSISQEQGLTRCNTLILCPIS